MITLKTNKGDIKIILDFANVPKTSINFLNYVLSGFYNETIFHRVVKGFVIQGGGFTKDMQEKITLEPIENEADHALPNKRGTLAMARTSLPHSASSQFFINLRDNEFLNHTAKSRDGWGYCVFGNVIKGLDVVDEIAKAETSSLQGHQDVPKIPIIVTDVIVEKSKLPEKIQEAIAASSKPSESSKPSDNE